jgi:hypothetical protein
VKKSVQMSLSSGIYDCDECFKGVYASTTKARSPLDKKYTNQNAVQ